MSETKIHTTDETWHNGFFSQAGPATNILLLLQRLSFKLIRLPPVNLAVVRRAGNVNPSGSGDTPRSKKEATSPFHGTPTITTITSTYYYLSTIAPSLIISGTASTIQQ
ncbi:hypothetical protein N7488_005092 [Penicillium malachiteum]|nr:hypothetical protein N7488_005092 [Penicillium malachiteum]